MQVSPIFRSFEEIERVEVDVVQNMQKMGIRSDSDFLRAPLKERARAIVFFIEVICIANIKATDEFCETSLNML